MAWMHEQGREREVEEVAHHGVGIDGEVGRADRERVVADVDRVQVDSRLHMVGRRVGEDRADSLGAGTEACYSHTHIRNHHHTLLDREGKDLRLDLHTHLVQKMVAWVDWERQAGQP